MNRLIMLIGLPASGKSTIAKEYHNIEKMVIHSPDELRLELFGNYNVTNKNKIIFNILHRNILDDLKKGIDCVYDATNLSMKKRKQFLLTIPDYVYKEAIVVATNYLQCVERDSSRVKRVGIQTIQRMRKNFQFPLEEEGFNNIEIRYTDDYVAPMNHIQDKMNNLKQDNPHHILTLGQHCSLAFTLAIKENDYIRKALSIHDVGKLYTKSYVNSKGVATNIAHYYGHQNVGAYESMFILKNKKYSCENKYIVQLINYHMQPYDIKTERSKKKWLNIFGKKLYNDIFLINKYDILAH